MDTPSSGQVYFAEHELGGASDDELTDYRRRHVGFVFQFYNLIPSQRAAVALQRLGQRKRVELDMSDAHRVKHLRPGARAGK
jgi:ABC-type lipoprotein export system ATPase subunit